MNARTGVQRREKWRRLPTALLDGDFPWGAIVSAPARYGAAQRRLVVYPPGIDRYERRWLRAWRGWPMWGGVVWFVLLVAVRHVTQPWTALAISCAVPVAAGATAFVMAGDNRFRVRTLDSSTFAAAGDAEVEKQQRKYRLLTTTLVAAHEHHLRGELTNVQYERIWWQAYDALAPTGRPGAALTTDP